MAESITAARPYARAVFDLAKGKKDGLKKWSDVLAAAAVVAGSPDMRRAVASPGLSAEQKAELVLDVLSEVHGGKNVTTEVRNFVRLLAENGRLGVVPAIVAEFERQRADEERTVHAELITARPISDEQREKIVAALKARLDRDVVLEVKVDESLIGGAVIRAGDMVIDGSAREQLSRLAAALSH